MLADVSLLTSQPWQPTTPDVCERLIPLLPLIVDCLTISFLHVAGNLAIRILNILYYCVFHIGLGNSCHEIFPGFEFFFANCSLSLSKYSYYVHIVLFVFDIFSPLLVIICLHAANF